MISRSSALVDNKVEVPDLRMFYEEKAELEVTFFFINESCSKWDSRMQNLISS